MPLLASDLLKLKSHRIMELWENRANAEVEAAFHLASLALRDSLPELLEQIGEALSTTIDRTEARRIWDRKESLRIGQKHGRERAKSATYTMDQMIFEYRILREVICDVMEEEDPLSPVSREVIVGAIEQAVNDAATQFSLTLKNIQERISATLAHDLRGPITAAKLCSQLMIRNPQNQDLILATSLRISGIMERIDQMIRELLDASLLRANANLPLNIEPINLVQLAQECTEEFNLIYDQRFVLNSGAEISGYWNRSSVRRIIENLATNAVKYGAPNTPITLSLRQTGSRITLIVHNQGTPIPQDERSVLFEEFRRAKSASSELGWGLGLNVVKTLTSQLQGTVRVESLAGTGTSFIVEMPLDCRAIRTSVS